jgi:hypothetical protein
LKLPWLESRKGLENRGHERPEVHDPIGAREEEKNPEGERIDGLLELDALIHGDQRVVVTTHPPKPLPVLYAGPAEPDDGADAVAWKRCGEI